MSVLDVDVTKKRDFCINQSSSDAYHDGYLRTHDEVKEYCEPMQTTPDEISGDEFWLGYELMNYDTMMAQDDNVKMVISENDDKTSCLTPLEQVNGGKVITEESNIEVLYTMTSRQPLQSTAKLPSKNIIEVPSKKPDKSLSCQVVSSSRQLPSKSLSQPVSQVGKAIKQPTGVHPVPKPSYGLKPAVVPKSAPESKPVPSKQVKFECKEQLNPSSLSAGSLLPKMNSNQRWNLEDFDIGRPLGKVNILLCIC